MSDPVRIARIATLFLIMTALAACSDAGAGPDLDDPPGRNATPARVQADVEAILGGGLAGWWRASHGPLPGAALSTAADAHTSSWLNWGMLDAGREPRQPLITDPEYQFQFITEPWTELYRTLAAARDGLAMIEAGAELGEGGADTDRAVAFGKFLQGMALGQLAVLFDRAYAFDEHTDLESVALSPHPDVLAAALAKLDEAIALAEANDFTLPAEWVAFKEPMDSDRLARLARSYRARYRMNVARTPEERAATDWSAVLADARNGIMAEWAGYYDGDWENNWAWDMQKMFAGAHPIWARLDYRTIGPADAGGEYQAWLSRAPADRQPFFIGTVDRRITGATPTDGGTYTGFEMETLFRPNRGTDHFSFYWDTRWAHLAESMGVGDHPDFPVRELAFMEAEALFRMGDVEGAMAIVNASREGGELPPFTDAAGPAPGGDVCVPQLPDGSCGDLWEALKYEKRIELFHYGPFTEFVDDRGWGDLVPGTFVELPAPEGSLDDLLDTFYGEASGLVSGDFTESGIHRKRAAYEDYDAGRNANPGDLGTG